MISSDQSDTNDAEVDCDYAQACNLMRRLPALGEAFSLHGKVGAGTFSSVWLGSLRREEHLPARQRRWFAIKHLVPTVHPTRVEHELRCLRELGGRDNIIGVDLCLRYQDTVVFIMPYIPHNKFSEYALHMDAEETRRYMCALLLALSRVHAHGVIHRDIKPSNFLYDRTNRRFLLVDFGLAQRAAAAAVRSDLPVPGALKRPSSEYVECMPHRAKRVCVREGGTPLQHLQPDHPRLVPEPAAAHQRGGCVCAGRGTVCTQCLARGGARAPRAGTQGFRPPEVLLKYPHQTTAVDMWACGVILLSVLSGRYPFFRAGDDAAALAEFVSLFGAAPVQRAAAALGRQLVCSARRRALCLRRLCARLRSRALAPSRTAAAASAPPHDSCQHCRLPRLECVCRRERDERDTEGVSWCGFPDAAFDLLERLLVLDPRARISAAAALQHPFLRTDCVPTRHTL